MTEGDDPSGLYCWVPHARVREREAEGWIVAGNGMCLHHARYSVLMRMPDGDDYPYLIGPGCD